MPGGDPVKTFRFGLGVGLGTSPFRHGLRELGFTDCVDEAPSRLPPQLAAGEADAAILPASDLLTHPELTALPSGCIASRGAAHDVRLFSRIPLRFVQSVALDISARTSSALARLVLEEQDVHPTFVEARSNLAEMLEEADAAVLTGAPCMRADGAGLLVTDLGEEWLRLTGLPFVLALWVSGPDADHAALHAVICEAKKRGLAQVERVAAEEADRLGLDRDLCLAHLRDQVRYDLDAESRVGLERFRRLAVKRGLVADAGPARFALDEYPPPDS
jgi:predicted solute-binding protein